MTTYLADSSLLIALGVRDHVHHQPAIAWFRDCEPDIATCPITQGALVRFLLRAGRSTDEAALQLDYLTRNTWHRFWPDDLPYTAPLLEGIIGHRQVTDSYLVALAAHHDGVMVTLDRGLAALHPEVTLIQT